MIVMFTNSPIISGNNNEICFIMIYIILIKTRPNGISLIMSVKMLIKHRTEIFEMILNQLMHFAFTVTKR